MARPVKADESAVTLAIALLSARQEKHIIKAALKAKYKIHARTAETVISRARERIRQQTTRSPDEHRLDAYAFYNSIVSDTERSAKERILAQERIDKLLGLQRPERLEVSGPNAGPIETADWSKATVEELKTYRAIRKKVLPTS